MFTKVWKIVCVCLCSVGCIVDAVDHCCDNDEQLSTDNQADNKQDNRNNEGIAQTPLLAYHNIISKINNGACIYQAIDDYIATNESETMEPIASAGETQNNSMNNTNTQEINVAQIKQRADKIIAQEVEQFFLKHATENKYRQLLQQLVQHVVQHGHVGKVNVYQEQMQKYISTLVEEVWKNKVSSKFDAIKTQIGNMLKNILRQNEYSDENTTETTDTTNPQKEKIQFLRKAMGFLEQAQEQINCNTLHKYQIIKASCDMRTAINHKCSEIRYLSADNMEGVLDTASVFDDDISNKDTDQTADTQHTQQQCAYSPADIKQQFDEEIAHLTNKAILHVLDNLKQKKIQITKQSIQQTRDEHKITLQYRIPDDTRDYQIRIVMAMNTECKITRFITLFPVKCCNTKKTAIKV